MGLWITRAEGPKIGAKRPVGGNVFFPLDSGADFGEIRSCDRLSFPGSHRTVRPATGGLCCFWVLLTPKSLKAGCGSRAA